MIGWMILSGISGWYWLRGWEDQLRTLLDWFQIGQYSNGKAVLLWSLELNCWRRKACEPELPIQVTGVSHQLIQLDVLFGDTLADSKHLVLAVNLWSGFTRPLFAGRIRIFGCVDWNDEYYEKLSERLGGRIRIFGCVDWNKTRLSGKIMSDVSHLDLRVRGLKYWHV